MKPPRIERVPPDYEPGYPAALTPEQVAALLRDDRHRRLLEAAAAAGLALGTLTAQEGAAPDRGVAATGERQSEVLDVLARVLAGDGNWLSWTTFEWTENEFGSKVIVPHIPIMFGNSMNGVFDAERARQLARELFEAYGLHPTAEVKLSGGAAQARLDGLDRRTGIGFELRGRVEEQRLGPVVTDEPAADDLSKEEHAALTKSGMRIHVADLQNYPLMDGDQATPTLAYLAAIVDFLNEVTDGPDLDVHAILRPNVQRLRLPIPDAAAGVEIERRNGGIVMSAEHPTMVSIHIDPAVGVEMHGKSADAPPWVAIEHESSTAGRPAVMAFERLVTMRGEEPPMRVRVVQEATKVDVEMSTPLGFLPPAFDAARPFTLILRLPIGTSTLGGHVEIRAPSL